MRKQQTTCPPSSRTQPRTPRTRTCRTELPKRQQTTVAKALPWTENLIDVSPAVYSSSLFVLTVLSVFRFAKFSALDFGFTRYTKKKTLAQNSNQSISHFRHHHSASLSLSSGRFLLSLVASAHRQKHKNKTTCRPLPLLAVSPFSNDSMNTANACRLYSITGGHSYQDLSYAHKTTYSSIFTEHILVLITTRYVLR